MRVYASENEYNASPWKGTQPPNGQLGDMLARASVEVERLASNAVYETDPNGLPTLPSTAEAFRDATCAQVAYWCNTGDIDGSVAAGGSMGIGTVRLGATARMSANVSSRQDARMAPEVVSIMKNAGLVTSGVNTW